MSTWLPAEWETHEATWLVWPKAEDTWPDSIIEEVQDRYLEFMSWIAKGEHIQLLVDNFGTRDSVRSRMKEYHIPNDRVSIHMVPTDDAWVRDYGPDWVRDDEGWLALKWKFNSWGDKYEYSFDQSAGSFIAERQSRFTYRKEVLEGGSFETNGKGTFLLTEECLLNTNRNGFSKEKVQEIFVEAFGAKEFIWLKRGIVGDDTDGHVDDLCRFLSEDTIAIAVEKQESDPNAVVLLENRAILSKVEDRFRIVEIPMPEPIFFESYRLPASYMNFYISNEAVIVPVFGQSTDQEAMDLLAPFFSGRSVVGVRAEKVVVGLGAWHCLSKHQPRPVDN